MKYLTKPFNAAIVIAALMIGGLFWHSTETGEANNPHLVAAYGRFGVTATQIARLNVANVCAPVDPCQTRVVRLTFIDADGESGGGFDSPQMQTVVTLEPGRSAFFDIPGSLLVGGANRVQIRALVQEIGSPQGVPPNPVIPSLEVINSATGVTTVIAPVDPCRMRVGV